MDKPKEETRDKRKERLRAGSRPLMITLFVLIIATACMQIGRLLMMITLSD